MTHGMKTTLLAAFLILMTAAPGLAQRGGGGGGARGGGGGAARSGGAAASSSSSRSFSGGGSARQTRTAGASAQPRAGGAQAGTRTASTGASRSTSTSASRSTSVSASSSGSRNVDVDEVGDVKIAKGDEGWVAAKDGKVAAGDYDGHGGARDFDDGDSVRWDVDDDDDFFEDHDAWRVAVGVGTMIAIGTRLATPPPQYVVVPVSSTQYYYAEGAWYQPIAQGTEVVYQVVPAPVGGVVKTLPPQGCQAQTVNGTSYTQCGDAWYVKSSGGYTVVAAP